METLISKLRLIGVVSCLLIFSKTNAQTIDTTFNTNMNYIFGNLDLTKIPFGLLRDYAMEFTNLENFDGAALVDSNLMDKSIFKQIYSTLATARVTSAA